MIVQSAVGVFLKIQKYSKTGPLSHKKEDDNPKHHNLLHNNKNVSWLSTDTNPQPVFY